ncbi:MULTISPECIES: hypothetical protein [unclassified Streptomyces]|uniref:hypothetical protein n=1 Tax=unclassified Streptomyces TaxID=2593676 RepID=UPI002E80F697|nr:hypothetical protein [Streptomyces sp. NBC_00562]WUC24299.1 hypothetical protein OHA33_38950 [Streptomyces sp. NBC_00562]
MLVQVEAVRQAPGGPVTVRVRSAVGTAAAFWCGDATEVGREHHVEWTVDENVAWDGNTRPATLSSPALGEDGGQVFFRGRLSLTGDGGALLEVADAQILFDLADPPPPIAGDGTWVEVRVERNSVSLWPYLL